MTNMRGEDHLVDVLGVNEVVDLNELSSKTCMKC